MDYLISTEKCCIPHILKIQQNNGIIVYLDDIFDYYMKNSLEINKLMNISNKIALCFKNKKKPSKKNKTRIIFTPHGNKLIKEEEYYNLIKIIKPFYYEDFNNFIIKNENESFNYFTPKNLEELIELVKENKIIDTLFINELTNQGKMIHDGKIGEIKKCDCCDFKEEYLKYLFEIKEINSFILIQKHNFNELNKIIKQLNK
ncbi:hypothetical protein TUBRATIS_008190 [Tubulinosema ratisbonensis]|uniref:Uncharacterized protein n=1 Tax=Tubulinosema ratisbonensis TaxID=291195 RepID=A0A437ANI3_9MICR|nr:hypothetical protein TUBRATIS_008190 [Tubulinosema ratisbonensis]